MDFSHYPVMFSECIEGLNIKPNGIYVDCTAGGGGHSEGILKSLENGKLISIDQDDNALLACKNRFLKYGDKSILVKSNFSELERVLNELNIDRIDGVIMDLGVSSHQLDTVERGFSYNSDANLDMRMNPQAPLSAYDVVNTYSENELRRIISEYGEEKFAHIIARNIVRQREIAEIKTTTELVEVIKKSIPVGAAKKEAQHPAKRTFQAIRIEVNGELDGLNDVLVDMIDSLNEKGRLCVLTFHSLEDRIVKNAFQELEKDCICDKRLPVCVCNHKATVKLVNKKPITASQEEQKCNTRSTCAKLRIAEKL